MTDEEYVRTHWRAQAGQIGAGYWKVVGITSDRAIHLGDGSGNAEAWSAAAEYTRNRLEEIRQVDGEIILLRGMIALLASEQGDLTAPIYARTIARLEAILADLKRGMKEEV
jgi:hypothetical protein